MRPISITSAKPRVVIRPTRAAVPSRIASTVSPGVPMQEAGQHRHQVQAPERHRRSHPQGAARRAVQVRGAGLGLVQLDQDALGADVAGGAGLGQRHVPGGALQQLRADPRLGLGQLLADRGLRHAGRPCRARQAASLDDAGEQQEAGEPVQGRGPLVYAGHQSHARCRVVAWMAARVCLGRCKETGMALQDRLDAMRAPLRAAAPGVGARCRRRPDPAPMLPVPTRPARMLPALGGAAGRASRPVA